MKMELWNNLVRITRTRAGAGWIAVALSAIVLTGCATGPQVPPILQVPAGQKVLLYAYAEGVQVYGCEGNLTEPGKFAWKLKAPEAMLFDTRGSVIGSHFSGPTWEIDRDGSKVGGEVMQRSDSPVPNAIPWLLVRAKPAGGPGLFHDISYIHRVNTTGGLAPASAPTQSGQEVRVPYTAEYYFYRAK